MSISQLSEKLFLTDGGLETTLVFHDGMDLPYFAAFDLLKNESGKQRLRDYFSDYLKLAQNHELGFILESVTWRASSAWGEKMGYSDQQLKKFNHEAISLLSDLRQQYELPATPILISGCVGPRGDGYSPDEIMTEGEAVQYHKRQIQALSETECDFISALTIPTVSEAVGIVQACKSIGMPVVISFTVETDGCLPDGTSLQEAINRVDETTDNTPIHYMINCAHPTHFDHVLNGDSGWLGRIGGIRANASCKSHAELDESTEIDEGNPQELGQQYRELQQVLPELKIMGGCCGTDHRHVEAICTSCIKH